MLLTKIINIVPHAPPRRPISKQRWRRRKVPRWLVRRAPHQAIGSLIPPDLPFSADSLPQDLTSRRLSSPHYGGPSVRIPLESGSPVNSAAAGVLGESNDTDGRPLRLGRRRAPTAPVALRTTLPRTRKRRWSRGICRRLVPFNCGVPVGSVAEATSAACGATMLKTVRLRQSLQRRRTGESRRPTTLERLLLVNPKRRWPSNAVAAAMGGSPARPAPTARG